MFIYHFLISNILISLAIAAVLTIKSILGNKLSPRHSLYIWLFIVLLMVSAFIPDFKMDGLDNHNISDNISLISNNDINILSDSKDLYISVNNYSFLYGIWIIGILFYLLIPVLSKIKLSKLRAEKAESTVFNECCKITGTNAELFVSPDITSPMSCGIIRQKIILPFGNFNSNILKHIFLHELIHHKHRDILFNYFLYLISAFYWFNPMVHIMHSKVRLDMEIYCDYSAVELSGNNVEYGNAILKMAEKRRGLSTVTYFSVSKSKIKTRIIKISDFGKKYSPSTARFVFVTMTALTLVFALVINSYGYSINKSVNIQSANYVNLKEYFEDYEGCFVLYNTSEDKYIVYNKSMAEKRVSPNSTCKIPIALNGLENGIITAKNNTMRWDGSNYPFEEWQREQNINSAMRYSVNWYFQNIDESLTKNEIENFMNEISYGNCAIYNKNNYWLENSLKISAYEQTEFLRKLYKNEFGFNAANVNTLFNSIKISDGFYGKTGTGMINGKITGGWFVGMFNKEGNNSIFALRIEGGDMPDGNKAREIAEKIINDVF